MIEMGSEKQGWRGKGESRNYCAHLTEFGRFCRRSGRDSFEREPGADSNLENGFEGSENGEGEGDAIKDQECKQEYEEEDLEAKPPTLQNGDATSLGDSSRSESRSGDLLPPVAVGIPSVQLSRNCHVESGRNTPSWSHF